MSISGSCYCGALQYEIVGDVPMRGMCLCATCQKISGGAGNLFIGVAASNFKYTRGTPKTFAKTSDSPAREFCSTCGVHVAARSPKAPGGLIVRVGTMDDPSQFVGPDSVFWVSEKRPYHHVPDDIPTYETLPGKRG